MEIEVGEGYLRHLSLPRSFSCTLMESATEPLLQPLCSLYSEAKSAVGSERRGLEHVEVSQEDGGYEGQDLSKRGHAAPFPMTKLGGRMREAQSERGGVSADQAGWGEDKLTRSCCQIYLTSS